MTKLRAVATMLAGLALAALVFVAKRKGLLGAGVALAAVSVYVGSSTIPTVGCEAPDCFPDATNTGVPSGRSLTTVNNDVTLTTDGQVYEDKLVNGCITVDADNVTIRYVRVVMTGCDSGICFSDPGIGCPTGSNLTIEDSEVDCRGNAENIAGQQAIKQSNYTASRVELYGGCNDAMWCSGNCTIEDSFIHEIIPCEIETYVCGRDGVDPPHTDGIQIPGGASNITIDHNRIYGGYVQQDDPSTSDGNETVPEFDNEADFGNAAITMGGVTNIAVTDNLLAGGGWTLYCNQGTPSATNTYTGNRFSTTLTAADPFAVNDVGGFGPIYGTCGDEPGFDATNVYHDGPNAGDPVS